MTVTAPTLSDRDKSLTLVGLLLALLLGALDQTIVATAGPAIQRSLGIEASLYVWLTTAYLVASTVMVPIYGKLGDLYGRKPVIVFGLSLFLVASVLCGVAGSPLALILFRGLQGLGAGALFTTAFAIVADLYPPAERGRINGALGGVFGLSSVVGPLVGGFLTDTLSWQWVFFVNIPVGLLALGFILARMPFIPPVGTSRPSLDLPGAFWLVVAVVPLLLALSFGKSEVRPGETGFLWGSWQILAMFGLAAVGLVAFVLTERRAKDPLLDLSLFGNRTFTLVSLAIFVLGAGFLSAIVFLPLFMVNVVGLSATNSGLTTTPLTFGLIAGAITSGTLTTRTGRYKPIMLAGLAILIVGFAIMAFTLTPNSTQLEVTLKMIVLGLGLGPVVTLYTLAVQNALPAEKTGVATSSVSFFQSMGGTVGLAVIGTIFASTLGSEIASRIATATAGFPPALRAQFAGGGNASSGSALDPAAARAGLARGFEEQRAALRRALADGDATAARALLASPQTPPQLRGALEGVAAGSVPTGASAGPLEAALRGVDEAERAALAGFERVGLAVREGFTTAISRVYLIGLVIVLLGLAVTAMLPELPLRKTEGAEGAVPAF